MGLLSGLVNSLQRREIKKFIAQLRGEPTERLAERLIMLYTSRSIRLFPNPLQEQRMRDMGLENSSIESGSIYIYHYQKGNEVPIIGMMEECEKRGHGGLHSALRMQFFTNLATSYDGYDQLVREMWDLFFSGFPALAKAYKKIFPQDDMLPSRDVSKVQFLTNPRLITPHFFLTDSPITKELDIRRAMGRELGLG